MTKRAHEPLPDGRSRGQSVSKRAADAWRRVFDLAGRLVIGPDERERRVQPKDHFLALTARSQG